MESIPAISKAQMAEVDRLTIDEFGLSLIQMMENAGRNLADLAAELVGSVPGVPVVVLAGHGNNGGGGLVAARHLINRGADVQLFLTDPPEVFQGVPGQQLDLL